jgi:hypothetical protein
MFLRKFLIIIALVLMLSICGFNAAEGTDYLNLKLLIPVNGLEYEHASPNGVGFSLAASYLPLDEVKILMLSGGIKKYFKNKPKGFYVAGYPGIWNFNVKTKEPFFDPETFEIKESEFKGSATFFTFIAAIGWRGAWKHFTLATELGGGILSLSKIETTGINPLTDEKTTDKWKIGFTGFYPSLQLSLGYAF